MRSSNAVTSKRRIAGRATAALSASLILCANWAKAEVIFSCPFSGRGGDLLDRGFYIQSYPGTNLGTVTLAYCSFTPGTGSASLTARLGAYNGPIIGSTATASFDLSGSVNNQTRVTYDFGGAPVPLGGVVTFAQVPLSGPSLYYDVGVGTCPGIVETEGTSPPLDLWRRASIGIIVTQVRALVATNAPPTLTCPPATVVECGAEAELAAQVSDPEGNAMAVVWTLNGTAVQTNLVPASSPGTVTNITLSGWFPLGTNILAVGVTDGTNAASCTTSVTVVDTTPPVLSQVVASPTVLWPPNHKLVRVTLRASVSDLGGPATWSISGVQCNEPANARGDGNTSPDWSITDADTVFLRAERSGSGNARIYFIQVQATDAAGNQSEVQTVTVTVPKSPGRGK